jgi:flagellar protein FlaJ
MVEVQSNKKYLKLSLLVLTVISYILVIGYIFTTMLIKPDPQMVNILMILPTVVFLIPYLFISLFEIKSVESKMQIIPRFLRDIVDNVESGTDLISSIRNTTKNEYSVLNFDIQKLSNQLSWGVNFEDALLNFADNVGSKDLKRDFRLVIEARKVGGHVEKILRELSQKISLENLRNKERKSNLASNTFTGYISFFIFIFIIILVYNSLFVGLGENMAANVASVQNTAQQESPQANILGLYLSLFTLLAYELAMLSGFLFGMMQENNLIAGAPHVVILMFMTFIGFFFFIG